ncbi:mucin-5AC-like [Cyprinus carpio]|uniref:Mucin-5AC-like n=1 Tax=Cyprinus carpio TaxID=7962 RepID=A0A9Q9VWF4_CYPCA|nr:mucin-5AC-like [Cyprinus carpio]
MKINLMTVLNSLPATLKAELIFDPSIGVLHNETLMRMVLSSILISPDDGQLEQFFTAFTYITTNRNITIIENTAVRDTMLNLTLMALSPRFPLFQSNDYMLWFQINLVVLLASFHPSYLVVIPTNLSCDSYDAILKGLEKALAIVPSELLEDLKTSKEILILSLPKGCPQKNTPLPIGSKYVTTATTSSMSTTQLPTKASTGPAVSGEVFVILQIRLHIQYIDAYSNPASLEYQTRSRNITMELNHFYWKLYEPHFLRCYLMGFWPGSVGVDMQLIFKSDTVLPNKESIEDNLKSAIAESKVFLDIIPSSVVVVNQDGSSLTTRQTQSSQNVLIKQTSSAAAPVLSSVVPTSTPTDLSSTAPPNYVSFNVIPDPSTIIVPTDLSDTSVTTGPSVTDGSLNTTDDTHLSSTSSPNVPILSAVSTQKSSITAPLGTLSTADPAHLSHTAPYDHSSTGDPTDHSNTTVLTDPSITAVFTNQTSPTVGSSTTVHIERPSTTVHTGTMTSAVPTDLSSTTASTSPITTTDLSDSSKASVPVGSTTAAIPTDQSHLVVPSDTSTTEFLAHFSRTTLPNSISKNAIPTDRQSTTVNTKTSTTVVPADLSSTISPTGFTDTAVTSGPSVSTVSPGHSNNAVTASLSNTTTNYSSNNVFPTDQPSTTVHTGTSNTAVPIGLSITTVHTASFITKKLYQSIS